ncbi:MAG: hypothetical protein ACOY3N_08360, partial [Bradyrhizobium sp.]|uniref:hypothetical protein n=1 Tax=Bradyrhizobium sp. TaxID=376 RepID=UPI003BF2F8B7
LHIRRQKQRLIDIPGAKILAHSPSLNQTRSELNSDYSDRLLDPDNGLETASVQQHSPKSGKYVFWNEVAEFWSAGHSLIIYHHLNRTATVARQAEVLKAKFRERFPDAPLLRHFLARRGSCRHFWVVGQNKHAQALTNSIERISQTNLRECLEAD